MEIYCMQLHKNINFWFNLHVLKFYTPAALKKFNAFHEDLKI